MPLKSFKESELRLLPSGGFELLGIRCLDCGEVIFGRHPACLNCSSRKLEEITLTPRGELINYTILHVPPFEGWKGPLPYMIGEIRLPEGAEVMTRVVGVDLQNPHIEIGMEVEFTLEEADKDEEGNPIVVYVCRPVKRG